jgi:hypothetical protein
MGWAMRSFLLWIPLVLACGSGAQTSADAGTDATTPTKDSGSEAAPFGDGATASDAASDGPPVVLDAGGPFLCQSCVCGGTDHFCELVSGGVRPMPLLSDGGFGDASACDPDAGPTSCTPIPAQCLPDPSCDCVLANLTMGPACTCQLDATGNGIVVQCMLP